MNRDENFTPDKIGKVVEVRVKDSHGEHFGKYVGVLEAYTTDPWGGTDFYLRGRDVVVAAKHTVVVSVP